MAVGVVILQAMGINTQLTQVQSHAHKTRVYILRALICTARVQSELILNQGNSILGGISSLNMTEISYNLFG